MNEFEVGKVYVQQNGELRKVVSINTSGRLCVARMQDDGTWKTTGYRNPDGTSHTKSLGLVPGAIATGLAVNQMLYPHGQELMPNSPSKLWPFPERPETPRPGLYADPSAKRDAEHQPLEAPFPERFDPFKNFEVKQGYGSSLEGTAEREFCPLDRVFPMPNAWGRW